MNNITPDFADLSPGFASALDAQTCFRALLSAFSTPGAIVALPVSFTPPPGLSMACASLLLTLADAHTKVALPENCPAQSWLTFHTGAPTSAAAMADFCVATTLPVLASLRQGTDAEPEASTTLILDVKELDGTLFRLSGPGLKDPVRVGLPLEKAIIAQWHTQTHNAPRGVDIILCAQDRILALPRSLQIEEG